jgi:transposase-like protein
LEPIIKSNIEKGSNLYTDEWLAYDNLCQNYNHERVNHRIKQYANGKVSTNSVENRWSHLKRTIYGTYHWISKKHTQKYLDEFTLRNNTRQNGDKERFDLVLLSSVGKRLTYQQLIS